ncbi:MAG: efflux RND transporter permease subunit [Acetobacteraceae bacterium]
MFQAIVGFSLRQRIFVLIAAAVLVAWGLVRARDMPIDLFPEIRQPSVVVITEVPGMAAQDTEQLVMLPVEMALNGMPGVVRVRGRAADGIAYVQVVFEWGSDPFRDRQLVNERLQMVQSQLPHGAVPVMAPMASATGLIMHMAITGGASPMALREYADWVVRPRLLAIEGVSQVFLIGGESRTFRFTPNPIAMRLMEITLEQVETALRAFGTNTTGGYSDVHGTQYTIRNIGKTSDLDDMRNLVVAYRQGTPVLLGQIGEAAFAPRPKLGEGAFNGVPSVNLSVVRQPQANTVQVSDRVMALLDDLQRSAPAGVKLGMISFNQADMIKEAIGNVGELLRDAGIIVAVVLFVFLASVRPTIISLLSIPISLVISVIVFRLLGATLNTMTLGGIAIGLGQLVDDSVVNVENILRRLRENRSAARPASAMAVIAKASQEVRSGIVYATVIVLLVFIPLLAMPGQQGRMFGPLAIAYIVSIFTSLVVSITVTPALASYLLPHMASLQGEHGSAFARWLKRGNDRLLRWVLDNGRIVLAAAGIAVLAAAASVPFLPRSFLPEFNEGNIYVTMFLKPGITVAEISRIGRIADQILLQVPEVVSMTRRSGRYEADSDIDNDNEWPLKIRLDKGRHLHEVMDDIRTRLAVFSGDLNVTQFQIERMQSEDQGGRGDVILKIFGPDLATLRTLAARLHDEFARVPGMVDVAVEQQALTPQVRIAIDYARAKLFGITPAQIATVLESFSNGRTVSQVIENGRRFDVVIRLQDADRTPDALGALRIDTPSGSVPLSSFATITLTSGPLNITHEEGSRRIAVMANLDGRRDTAQVVAQLRGVLAAAALPAGYRTTLDGEFRQGEEGRLMLAVLTPVSILLIFVVLQQRFRSVVLCLIIMGNIPLALVGSVAAVWIAGIDLNLAAMVGFIAVTGIAVRNSLLKVSHFINLHLHEGMPVGRALVLRGSAERVMPVLMTAIAAGAALVPLLYTSDVIGTEILHPVAVAIFGGLISSTLLDTFTTPLLFLLFGERALTRVIAGNTQLAYDTF